MTAPIPSHITIIGPGLLGGSIGLALRRAAFPGRIVGVGRRQSTLDQALALRCIDHSTTDLAQGVTGADLVILATPVRGIIDHLPRLSAILPASAVVTDVGSTKQSIVQAAQSLRHPQMFVGSHPMAGSEQQGPQAARADLFAGKPVIVTPTDLTDPRAVDTARWLWSTLGMTIHAMDPASHDLAAARVSHLPHALATLLTQQAQQRGGLEIASTGFADTTRIAAGPAEIWADIFIDNAPAMLQVLGDFTARLDDFKSILDRGDRQALLRLLATTAQARANWKPQAGHPRT